MRMWQCYLRIALRARSASGLLDALGLGYDLPVGQAVYAIDAFPDDDLLWRIEWIGGVGYNTSVPSEPQIDVCLAQLPKGEKNPLSARARSSQVEKRTVKIGVGPLPYVWIGSVWQKRRPVITNLSAYRGCVSIDATSLRMVALGMATSRYNAIPRSSYLFGASWPNVPDPPGCRGTRWRSLCGDGSHCGDHPVLLRPIHAARADSASFANSADRFANNFASDTRT